MKRKLTAKRKRERSDERIPLFTLGNKTKQPCGMRSGDGTPGWVIGPF